jgi:hypothetical protein
MDPLIALSTAGTIVQFVESGIKIVRGTYHIYKSATGALPVNEELEIITRDLAVLATKLRRPLQAEHVSINLLHNTQQAALQGLCNDCIRVADRLIARLEGLKVQGRHQTWRSFQHAIKAAWAQKEVDELTSTLSKYHISIKTYLQLRLRYGTTLRSLKPLMLSTPQR